MKDRWRGRRAAGLAVVVLLGALIAAAAVSARDDSASWLVVRNDGGAELTRIALPASHELTLRYRNSLYHSIAEEHFRVTGDTLDLHALSADELAVLEEYYGAFGATHHDATMAWTVTVERPPVALPLRIQATALGERTLIVEGREISLWRLVVGSDDTSVILSVEGGA